MGNIFDGMLLWEIILLLLGVVLFLTIIGGFIYLIKKDKLKTSYGSFFLIPIIMIAFPSIRYVNFMNGLFEINTLTEKWEENPDDTENLKKLEEIIKEEANSPIRTEKELVAQAKANTALENFDEAEKQVETLLEKDPDNEEVKIIKARIEVSKAQRQLEQDSTNVQAQQKVEANIKVLEKQNRIPKVDRILIEKAGRNRTVNQ